MRRYSLAKPTSALPNRGDYRAVFDGTLVARSLARQPFASARDVSNHGWKGASFGFRKRHSKRRQNYGKEANFGDLD